MNVETRQMLEKRIARAFITDMLRAGFTISVWDGEAMCLKNATKMKEVLGAMFSTDEDKLFVSDPITCKTIGVALFIYGNDGWDVLADYSIVLEPFMILTRIAQDNAERRYS